MKKVFLLLSLAFLLAGTITAQSNFEGRIVYGIKLLGDNADQMSAFMPDSYEYTISGSNLKFKINGGMTAAIMGEFLVDGENEKVYMIRESDQIAYLMPDSEEEGEDENNIHKITKEDEVVTILGHKCQKYKIIAQSAEGGEIITQYMWVTKEINIARPSQKMKSGGDIFVEGLEGFPLKIQTTAMGITMVMTVTEITEESIPASEFKIPAGYEIKDFDPMIFGGMGR